VVRAALSCPSACFKEPPAPIVEHQRELEVLEAGKVDGEGQAAVEGLGDGLQVAVAKHLLQGTHTAARCTHRAVVEVMRLLAAKLSQCGNDSIYTY
jgi:hypothetical protein